MTDSKSSSPTALPAASPPDELALYQLPTGTYTTRAAFAVTGGSFRDKREFAATAVLIHHPKGDLLIDAGFGADVAAHVQMLARVERAPLSPGETAAHQLGHAGYDRSQLLGVLVTHVHWDHVSGLDSLRVPVLINAEERRYGAEDAHGAVWHKVSAGLEIQEYAFDGPEYLGFARSHDVYGDGSVVIAFAGGHTNGSVVVFVTLPSGQRYAFIGDLTWQMDGISRGAQRPWMMRRMADVDPNAVRQGLQNSIALRDVVQIVPAHDIGAYATIPTLPTTWGGDAA